MELRAFAEQILFATTLEEKLQQPAVITDLHPGPAMLAPKMPGRPEELKFKEQESGCYVHMTSTSGLIGTLGQANYNAAKMGLMALSKSIALDMQRFNVRSNCVSPFAWSRMIGTIPTETDEEKARVERIKTMDANKIAPLAIFLLSDLAKGVTGQIFAARKDEIYLFSQPRPVRSVHRSDGWTPQTLAEHMLPAVKGHLTPPERSGDVFSWDPV